MPVDALSPQVVVAALRRTRLWGDATDESVRAAAAAVRHARFARGERLIRRGRPPERLIVLLSGRVEVRVRGVAGTVTTVAMLGAGECVGEMSLLTGEPASADVVAAEDLDALEMPAEDFARIARPDAQLLHRFVRILSDRLQRADFAMSLAHERESRFEELLLEPTGGETDFAGKSPAARKLRERVAALAATNAPILVFGEEGTKRDLVVRMIHLQSAQREGPLLSADCAGIADDGHGDRLLGTRGEGIVSHTACYMDAAEGGTILLRRLDLLPPPVQERLARYLEHRATHPELAARGARVVATCGEEAGEAPAASTIVPAVLAAFGDRHVRTPPLRDRKRDIPDLATALLQAHAARLGRPARAFDEEAMKRLVSYDYRFANERELDAAIERAVVLADDGTVRAEEIFLGPPPSSQPHGIDLLHLPGIDLRRIVPRLPAVGRVAAGIAYVALLYGCFVADAGPDGNTATFLVWSFGWPALALSFFLAGRAACAVCPMGAGGEIAAERRASRRSLPAWVKDRGHRFALAGFFVVVLVEQTTGMRHSPLLTGLLLVSILAGAVATGLVFPRRTWCRHLCPLGGFAGACATSGVLELRPSFDVCSARCTGHACFKGDEKVPGCPLFNHVMFVDGNQDCVLCMRCVRSCPNDSPRLNLRLPARELWAARDARPALATAVLLFAGMTLALAFVQAAEGAPASVLGGWMRDARFAFVGGALAAGAVLPLLATWPYLRSLERRGDEAAASLFRRRVAALAPLVTAGFIAYQLAHLPALPWLRAVVTDDRAAGGSGTWTAFSVLALIRVGVVSAGLLTTAVILWQVDRSVAADAELWRKRWRRDLGLLAVIVGYWAALLGLMCGAVVN